jgi:L,D-transpeptidase YcbB
MQTFLTSRAGAGTHAYNFESTAVGPLFHGDAGNEALMFLKSGSVRKSILVSLAVMLNVSVMGAHLARAGMSDEERQALFNKMHGLKAAPGVSSSATSSHGPVPQGKATTATEVFTAQNVEPMLSVNGPSALQAAESRYAQIVSNGGWPNVPKGTYKKGGSNGGIAALNQRLFIEGYLRPEATQGEFAAIYTTATQDAVTRFQRNNGLAATGLVDGPTLQALNVSAASRLSTIRANIPRLAEYSKELGARYIVVNVPAQQIEAVEGNRVYSRHNAIVGRPERPTPVVMAPLDNVAFNPYWNAPPSIIERDIVPKIIGGNSQILKQMNIKVFEGVGGPEVNPNTINWRNAVVDNYHFRQEPGGENAMATAKINFNSPFGIYLHDTPERQLFQAGGRFFSSGCVRVDKVAILINWILNGQDGFNPSRIEELAQSEERLDEKIINPPQLRVAYLTAWPTTGGTVAFRGDVYGLDGTGFILGQPLPVGEKSAEGQRFVLKPIPRLIESVDASEAEGFSWFGRRSSKSASATPPKSGKPTAFGKVATTAKPDERKPKSVGLFDWSNYHPETDKTNGLRKKTLITSKTAKPSIFAKKAKPSDKAVVATAKKKKPGDKAVVADAKKAKLKTTDTAAAKVATSASRKAVKPKVGVAKKVDAKCKPGAGGKLPTGCKVEAIAQPVPAAKSEKTVSATN